MYLKKVKGNVVYLSLGGEDRNTNNLMHTKRYRPTQLAEFLGAKEVKLLDETVIMRDDMVILDYYDSLKDNSFKEKCKLCISVYWCDLNEALTLEEIWYEGNKVGYLNYSRDRNVANLNEVLEKEDYNFFKISLNCYDFTNPYRYK